LFALLCVLAGMAVTTQVSGASHRVATPGPQIFATSLSLENSFTAGSDVDSIGRTLVLARTVTGSAMWITRVLANGDLDESFGDGGHVKVDLTVSFIEELGGLFFPYALAVDDSDRAVIVGGTNPASRVAALRLTIDGEFDPIFDGNGFATFDFGGRNPSFVDVAAGRDGTLVVVGAIDHPGGFSDMLVARIGASGQVDETFGEAGIVSVDVDRTGGWNDSASAVELRRDGRIVVVGEKRWVAGGVEIAVVQLLANGQYDAGFGDNGIVRALRSDEEFLINQVPALSVARDGKIVVLAQRFGGSDPGLTQLVRLLDNGTPDPTFGVGGLVEVVPQPWAGAIQTMADGRTLVLINGSLRRFEKDGSLDDNVGIDGFVRLGGTRLHWGRDGIVTTVGDDVRRWELSGMVPGAGFWLIDSSGAAHDLGEAVPVVGPGAAVTGGEVVGVAPRTGGDGYLLLTADGAVVAEGSAIHLGDAVATSLSPGETWVAIVATPSNNGYWLISSEGRVSAYGDAANVGGLVDFDLDEPVVAGAATPSGGGYVLLGRDGGVFVFGDAQFRGSVPAILGPTGAELDAPIVAIALTPSGAGYWIVASDGGIFAFGDALFLGSIPGVLPVGATIDGSIVDIETQPGGYTLFGSDGGVFTFGRVPFIGSLGGSNLARPIVAVVGLANPTPIPAAPILEVEGIALCSELAGPASVGPEDLDELTIVADQVRPLLTDDGLVRSVRVSEFYGAVEVDLWLIDDDDAAAEVARRAGSFRLCLNGPTAGPVAVQIQPGLRMADRVGWLGDGEILVATDETELEAFVAASPVGFDVTSIDLRREVVVALGVGTTPACPPVVSGLNGERTGRVTLELDGAGYGSCQRPLTVLTYIVRLDRAQLATGAVTFVHPSSGAEFESTIQPVPPATAGIDDISESIDGVLAILDLPVPGETLAASLTDGTPVFVIRHDDGGVSVIDPQMPPVLDNTNGALASWATRSRRLIGFATVDANGVWDEYGQSLDVGPRNDLVRHVVEITAGGRVRVGQRSAHRLGRDPITGAIDSGGRRIFAGPVIDFVTPDTPAEPGPEGPNTQQTNSPFVDLDMLSDEDGLLLTRSDGTVEVRGTATYLGDRPLLDAGEGIVALVVAPGDDGYWLVSDAGRVFTFGSAPALGDVGDLVLRGSIVDAAPASSGIGYYLLGSDGGVFAFGTALYWGSVPELVGGRVLNSAATAIAVADGGYFISTGETGLFIFGAAGFGASLPPRFLLLLPDVDVVDMEVTASADGYRTVGRDGGVFSYGTRLFRGSAAGVTNTDTVAIVSRADGSGYLVLDSGGDIWAFGDSRSIGVQRFEGVGAATIDISLSDPSIIYSTSDSGEFWINALKPNGDRLRNLAWKRGGGSGYDLLDTGGVRMLQVIAVGPWTIEVLPITYARIWRPSGPSISGTGSDVVLATQLPPTDLVVEGESNTAVSVSSVRSGDRYKLARIDDGPQSLRRRAPTWSGPTLIEVRTRDGWSITPAPTQAVVHRSVASALCRDDGRVRFNIELLLADLVENRNDLAVVGLTSATWPGWVLTNSGYGSPSISATFRGIDCANTAGTPVATLNLELSNGESILVRLVVRPVTFVTGVCSRSSSGASIVGEVNVNGFEGFGGSTVHVSVSSASGTGVSGWASEPALLGEGGSVDFEFSRGPGSPCPPSGFIVGKVLGDLSNGDRFVAYITS